MSLGLFLRILEPKSTEAKSIYKKKKWLVLASTNFFISLAAKHKWSKFFS